jgi:Cation efflux family
VERTQKAALASVGIGLVVLGLKFAAYWLTGSVALYSDALESTINVLAAGAAFFAIGFSARPADSNHPYGHYKAEYFSAVFEGGTGRRCGPRHLSLGLSWLSRAQAARCALCWSCDQWGSQCHQWGMGVGLATLGSPLAIARARGRRAARIN